MCVCVCVCVCVFVCVCVCVESDKLVILTYRFNGRHLKPADDTRELPTRCKGGPFKPQRLRESAHMCTHVCVM